MAHAAWRYRTVCGGLTHGGFPRRQSAQEAFAAIDTDGNGSLNTSEIRRLIVGLGREEGTLDSAALALAMAEMRGTGCVLPAYMPCVHVCVLSCVCKTGHRLRLR